MIRLSATVLIAMGLVLPSVLFADSEWANSSSFGVSLHPDPERGNYSVLTYIPAGTLLFDVDRSECTRRDRVDRSECTIGDDCEGRPYTAVTTQDGVRLCILNRSISRRNTSEGLGRFSVIFHSTKRICTTDPSCDTNEPNQSLEIYPGETFNRNKLYEVRNLTRLTGQRNGIEISGIIPITRLQKWNRDGAVTFTDRPQPELSVVRKKGRYFDLECGVSRQGGGDIQRVYGGINKYDKIINDHFELAYIREDGTTKNGQPIFNVELRKDHGENNRSYEYRVYRIKENNSDAERDTEPPKTYAARIIYECDDGEKQRISSVVLKRKKEEDGRQYKKYTLEPWGTPPDLERYTGTPHYLYSVNNRRQYFALRSRLAEHFHNLAEHFHNKAEFGYFLAEFNRSCWEEQRRTRYCATHSYESSEQ